MSCTYSLESSLFSIITKRTFSFLGLISGLIVYVCVPAFVLWFKAEQHQDGEEHEQEKPERCLDKNLTLSLRYTLTGVDVTTGCTAAQYGLFCKYNIVYIVRVVDCLPKQQRKLISCCGVHLDFQSHDRCSKEPHEDQPSI